MNYHSKFRDKLSRTVNYCLKNSADWNNLHPKSAGNFPRNIVSRNISLESQEKPGILSKFTCITFAQYCSIRDVASEGVYAIAGWIPIVGSDLQS